jgi:hypothetical protein
MPLAQGTTAPSPATSTATATGCAKAPAAASAVGASVIRSRAAERLHHRQAARAEAPPPRDSRPAPPPPPRRATARSPAPPAPARAQARQRRGVEAQHSVPSTAQPIRAAASEKVDGPGRARHSPGARSRAMTDPAPNQNGSPEASTTTRRPAGHAGSATPRRRARAIRSAPSPPPAAAPDAGRAHHHLGLRQRAAACGRQAVRSILAQTHDRQPGTLRHAREAPDPRRHDRGHGPRARGGRTGHGRHRLLRGPGGAAPAPAPAAARGRLRRGRRGWRPTCAPKASPMSSTPRTPSPRR